MQLIKKTYKNLLRNNFELYSSLLKENSPSIDLVVSQYREILDDIFHGIPKDKLFIEIFEDSLNRIIYNEHMHFAKDYKHELITYAKQILSLEFEMEEIVHVSNPKVCASCEGECCKIYLSPENGGTFDKKQDWKHWVTNFHNSGDISTINPLYDASFIHLDCHAPHKNEAKYNHKIEVSKLKEKEIDVNYCQFKGSNGCIIPIEKRPVQCLRYTCRKLRCLDENYREKIVKVKSKKPRFIDEKWVNFLNKHKLIQEKIKQDTIKIINSL